ncbi:hypothetical protein LINPERPRIM_LOCUS31822, partial [Linum perenne]
QNGLSTSSATQFYADPLIADIAEFETGDPDNYEVAAPIYSDPSDISKTPRITLNELNASITDAANKHKFFLVDCTIKGIRNGWCYTGCQACAKKEHVEHLGVSPPSSYSPKSCVSKLGATSPKSSMVIEKTDKRFNGTALTYNDEMEDDFSDDASLATMRKKLKMKKRKFQISDDE